MVYVHYDHAIRQAVLDHADVEYNAICNASFHMVYYFRVAGIKNLVRLDMKHLYYSACDAADVKNPIEFEAPSLDFLNSLTDGFTLDRSGDVWAYVWDGSMPRNTRLRYHSNFGPAVFRDGRISLKLLKEMPFPFYKTADECRANNRPKVITF